MFDIIKKKLKKLLGKNEKKPKNKSVVLNKEQEFAIFYEKQTKRKKYLIKKLSKNISDLQEISNQLIAMQEFEYEDKIQKLLKNTLACDRILLKLDIMKPYSKEIMIKIKNHTDIVNYMVLDLCDKN